MFERSTAIARSTIVAAVSALLLGLGAWSATAAPPSDPFVGTWESVDLDGSNQTLTFRGRGPVKGFTYFDDDATGACETGGEFTARGTGEVDGDTIVTSFNSVRCEDGTRRDDLRGIRGVLVHDAATDTLTDDFGVVWSRA